MNYLIINTGNYRFGLDISNIIEIIIPGIDGYAKFEQIKPAQKMIFREKGTNEESEIPLYHIADYLLGHPAAKPDNFKIVVCQFSGNRIGLIVDNADEIIKPSPDDIIPSQRLPGDLKGEFITGLIRDDKSDRYIVSLEKIFNLIKTG